LVYSSTYALHTAASNSEGAKNMKKYDIFLGRVDGWHTRRIEQFVSHDTVKVWLDKGYRIETEHQIGTVLHEVYLVPA